MATRIIDDFSEDGNLTRWTAASTGTSTQTGLNTANVAGGIRKMSCGIGRLWITGGQLGINLMPHNLQQARLEWTLSPTANMTSFEIEFGTLAGGTLTGLIQLTNADGTYSWYRFSQSTPSVTLSIPAADFGGVADLTAVSGVAISFFDRIVNDDWSYITNVSLTTP